MKRARVKNASKVVAGAAALGIVLAGCGKKDSEDEKVDAATQGDPTTGLSAGNMNLSTLPNLALAMKTSSSSLMDDDGFDLTGVVGTPVKMSELASTDTYSGTCKKWDRYFFGCAVSAVNAASTATSEQKGALQRGEAVCRNIAETANILREFGGGSMCYMSKVPKLSTKSVTVGKEGGGITASSYADMMKPVASGSKLIKIMPKSKEGGNQDIFITVPKAEGNSLTYRLDYCEKGQPTGYETIVADLSAGKLLITNVDKRSENGFSSVRNQIATVFIKKDGDGVAFDLSKDRSIEGSGKFEGSWGSSTSKFMISLDKDGYLTNMNNASQSWTYNGTTQTGTQKVWAKTQVTGDNGFSLKVPQMGMSMEFKQGSNSFSPSGAVEWQTDTYADTTSSALYTTAKAYKFTDSVFSGSLEAPSPTFASDQCTRTPDAEVTFDMTTSEAGQVQKDCEGDDKLRDMYQLCNNSDIQSARTKMWQSSLTE